MKKIARSILIVVSLVFSLQANTKHSKSLSEEDSILLFGSSDTDVKLLSNEEMDDTKAYGFFSSLLVNIGISAGAYLVCRTITNDCSFKTKLPNINF